MFGLRTKPKPSLRVDTAEERAKPKTSAAKAYFIGVAATSQKLIRKQLPEPSYPMPTTPEDKIISLPLAAPQTIPGLTPDKGIITPPSSEKKRPNKMSMRHRAFDGSPTWLETSSSPFHQSPANALVSSNESDAECVFCSVGLHFASETEPIHQLQCGHYSHDRCLYRLDGSMKEIGDYDVLCSMCERPAAPSAVKQNTEADVAFTSASDFAPGFRPGISTPISNGIAGRVMSRSSSFGAFINNSETPLRSSIRRSQSNFAMGLGAGGPGYDTTSQLGLKSPMLEPQADPASPTSPLTFPIVGESDSASVSTGRATLWSGQSQMVFQGSSASKSSGASSGLVGPTHAPLSPTSSSAFDSEKSCLGLSARTEVKSLLASDHAFSVECSPRMRPFRILTATDQPSKGNTRVVVKIQAEPGVSGRDLLSEYRFTAKDIQHSIKVRQHLSKMHFDFKAIALADMTTLRLHTSATVTSPDSRTLNWKDCEAYLFDDLIVITRGQTVAAVMTLRHSKAQVHVEPSRPSFVELKFANPDMIDLNLNVTSPAIAHMWKHAFADPAAHFPLDRGEGFDKYVAELETRLANADLPTLSPYLPAELVLCLPVNSKSQALVMQQAVRAVIRSLSYRDKLGLIMFSGRGVERKIELTAPHSLLWETALDGIEEQLGKQSSLCDLDIVLNGALQLLSRHQTLDATASIILASDSDMQLQSVSVSLARARVPVHTIGLSDRHNALALSTLAQQSAGSYHYAKTNHELDELVHALIRLESRYTHKNVTLRFKPRISTKIVAAWGRSTAPSAESAFMNPLQPISQTRTPTLDVTSKVLEWKIGLMRMSDIRELIVEVQGDVPLGSNILQVSLEATHVLSPDDTACVSTFRVPVPAPGENVDERLRSLLIASSVTQGVLVKLERAMVKMLCDETRAAYDQLILGLQHLQSARRSGLVVSKPMIALLEAYEWLLDMCCDDIVKNSQRTQGFMLDLLQRVWLFHTQQSLLKRDPVEGVFYDNEF